MIYRPINPSDIFCCQGIYGGFRPKLPATPGLEGQPSLHPRVWLLGAGVCPAWLQRSALTSLMAAQESV